jgi:hypothetical protein
LKARLWIDWNGLGIGSFSICACGYVDKYNVIKVCFGYDILGMTQANVKKNSIFRRVYTILILEAAKLKGKQIHFMTKINSFLKFALLFMIKR